MRKLTLQQIYHLKDETVYIEHKELGHWYDQADGVYTLFDMTYLYLTNSDVWLNCDDYNKIWRIYTVKENNKKCR